MSTFKLDWTTKNRLPIQRTFALLCTALLAWERDMADSEQTVFRVVARDVAQDAPHRALSASSATSDIKRLIASAQSLPAEDQRVMQRYMEAGLQVVAHKKTNPDYVVPPHFCANHGMCFHESSKCNANKPKK